MPDLSLSPARLRALGLAGKVRLNWQWGRTHAWADLVEEHDWNPLVRLPRDARKALYARRSPVPVGTATAVLLVGAQRSGTNMIVHGLEQSPQFAVYNEGNRRAFVDFRLRPVEQVRGLVDRSRHPYVLVKPLCDSHRLLELLAELSGARPAKGVWAYRGVDGRVRSYVMKFADKNLLALRDFAAGRALDHWMVQGISADSAQLVRSLEPDSLSPASGAALFWYVRNAQYFEQGMHRRDDIRLARYESFLDSPQAAMQSLCEFLGCDYRPEFLAHITARPAGQRAGLELHPEVRRRCTDLQRRLDETYAAQTG